jgi:heat shock protein HslJ
MRGCVKLVYFLAILPAVGAVALLGCASKARNTPAGGETWEPAVIEETTAPVPEVRAEAPATMPAISRNAVYEELLNIVWLLSEIQVNYGKMALDRTVMSANGMGDIYSLQLTEEGISGKAAPNRYFTTFELRYNHDFRLRPIVGTMLPANINIGGLMENEYYWYLQRATHWEIVNNALELYAYPAQNESVVLRYLRQ